MRTINHEGLLAEVCAAIEKSPWAAVDCEADSLHHYVEKLCLLQVSIPGEDYVIDPLVPLDLSSLAHQLSKKSLILHGADFDIRILNRFYGFKPTEVFDTMIAAQLLGYEKQGLADLALKHCGIALSKKAQRADWSERPLDDELIDYAAKDTHYLKRISDNMKAELVGLGRLEWLKQCCERLIIATTRSDEKKAEREHPWQIKGSKELSARSLAILKTLWHWREEEARRRDRPSFKVLHAEVMVHIAKWAAENHGKDVTLLPGAPRNVKGEHRDSLNRLVKEGWSAPPLRYMEVKKVFKGKRPDENSKKRLATLKEVRQQIAAELKIQPGVLVTNAGLEAVALEAPKSLEAIKGMGFFMPWQVDVLGVPFLKIVTGP